MRKRKWMTAILTVCLSCGNIYGEIDQGKDRVWAQEISATENQQQQNPSQEERVPEVTDTPEPTKEPDTEEDTRVYLGLDTMHIYDHMENSFSQGYIPVTEGNVVHLTVPFSASGNLKDDQITVDLELGEEAPFVYASYRKTVAKEKYTFEGKTVDTYLYQCDIQLEEDRSNGRYPVMVKAVGYNEKGEEVKLEYRIFVTINDGKEEEPQETPSEETDHLQEEIQENVPEIFSESFSSPEGGAFQTETREEVVHQPKLILTKNTLVKKKVPAGEKQEFILTFKNSSKQETICNLKINGKAGEDTITMENSSFYFEKIKPQETIELTGVLEASPMTEQKSIPLEFSFDYENDKGTAYSSTEIIYVSVLQSVQVIFGGINLPEKVYSLETVSAGVQIQNVGKAPVYNVRVELAVPGLFPTTGVFAGNMEPGDSSEGSMKIYVGNKKMKSAGEEAEGEEKEKYGSVTGIIRLTYEDAFGKTYTQEQEITTVIQKPQITELKVEEEKKETNQWWVASLVILFLLFISSMAVMGRKLKKQREMLTDLQIKEIQREE